MIGKSWGGFNGLQIAALRPPRARAVDQRSARPTTATPTTSTTWAAACSARDMLPWASTMLAYNARPPDPAVVGEGWREMWLERLEQDAALRRGVARAPAARRLLEARLGLRGLRRPSRAPCTWSAAGPTATRNAILRLLAGYPGVRKGLIGPWAHTYPHDGVPGPGDRVPAGGLRWWDHWLKGEENGIMDEPMLRVWMQDAVPPGARPRERPGRWVAEPAWPSPGDRATGARARRRAVGLAEPAAAAGRSPSAAPSGRGLDAGHVVPVRARPATTPPDQRADDGRSPDVRHPRRSASASSCSGPRSWR